MAYRTHLTLTCGDRHLLESTVDQLRSIADRKGARTVGPHARPTRELSVPLFKRPDGDARFATWAYKVYTREMEVIGHESVARAIANHQIDARVAVALSIEEDEPIEQRR